MGKAGILAREPGPWAGPACWKVSLRRDVPTGRKVPRRSATIRETPVQLWGGSQAGETGGEVNCMTDVQQGLVVCTGLACLLAFSANLGLLIWLLFRKREHELLRCSRCGRMVICPHCNEDSTGS